MITKAVSILCAAVVAVSLAALPVQAYSLDNGVKFNRPIGTVAQRFKLTGHVNGAIEHTRRGSTIQIAVYSLDRPSTAHKLLRAHRRGVNVRIVVNRHYLSPAVVKLKKVLGSSLKRRSFLRICAGGCRGPRGPMHLKFFTFSKTGTSRNVVMLGSGNLTTTAAIGQWNDLVTVVRRPGMYDAYTRIFRQAARKVELRNPYRIYTHANVQSEFFPRPHLSRRNDPIMRGLRSISCRGAAGGAGSGGRTVLRISMSSWNGPRGIALAEKVKSLSWQGCIVRVVYARLAPRVANQLEAGRGIVMRNTTWDRDTDGEFDLIVHHKYLTVSGNVGGDRSAWVTWTGSSNWSDAGISGDEMVVRVKSRAIHAGYVRNFNDIWGSRWSYWHGTTPYRSTARSAGPTSEPRFPAGWLH